MKKYLLENERIPEERIAIATGTQRELEGIDLFKENCPIEIIITVQALKEGWDCSFAYVFCSTANIHNATSVEQLLGRVLRMPYVQRRKATDLNKAYAHVSSPNFSEAASQLETSMVALGFDAAEAAQAIERGQPSSGGLPLFDAPVVVELTTAPDLTGLTEREHEQVILHRLPDGKATIEIVGQISEPLREKIMAGVALADKPAVEQKLREYAERPKRPLAPSERREAFIVPRLCAHFDGQLRLFDEDLILDAYSWDLLASKPSLSGFHYDPATRTFELDIDGGKIRTKFMGTDQLDLSLMPVEWAETDLVRWLDKELRQPDVSQEKLEEWIRRAVGELLGSGRFDLSTLVRAKYLLCRELLGAITKSRDAAHRNAYQELLFGPSAAIETSFNFAFEYDPKNYPANWYYTGSYHWAKHYYERPGELKSDGEEFECAKALDAQPEVLYWVRNLAGKKDASLWLQTASDLFYPDFVAVLKDGRTLVVEYKGEHISDTADTLEKRSVGEKFEEKSGGKALFLMAAREDDHGRGVYEQIRRKITGVA